MSEYYSVLVVDDDSSVLLAMKHTLHRQGYQVETAANGEEALSIMQNRPPDLVLCDYMMPGMNGIEVLQAMEEHCPDTVRILVTGHGDLDVAMAAINEGGVYKFILKPWNSDDLILMVRRALEHYQLIQEGKALMEMLDMALRQQEVKVRGLQDQVGRYRRMLGME